MPGSAKERGFRGAKGDNPTVIDSPVLNDEFGLPAELVSAVSEAPPAVSPSHAFGTGSAPWSSVRRRMVIACLCDGSVISVNYQVNPQVFLGLGNRNVGTPTDMTQL